MLFTQYEGLATAEVHEALSQLVEKEFLISPEKGEGTPANGNFTGDFSYQFKHVLLSDAVYSTLLQRDRRDLHTRVGEAIERVYPGQIDEYTEVLAGHFLRSPYLDRALHYLLLSGQKAARGYANEQALSLFRQAVELLPSADHSPEQALKVHSGLGDALLTAGDYSEAREHYIEAIETLGVPGNTGAQSDIPYIGQPCRSKSERFLMSPQPASAKGWQDAGESG